MKPAYAVRLIALPDGRVDWIERAVHLTVPFDFPLRRPRTGDADVSAESRLSALLSARARLAQDTTVSSRLDGRLEILPAQAGLRVPQGSQGA